MNKRLLLPVVLAFALVAARRAQAAESIMVPLGAGLSCQVTVPFAGCFEAGAMLPFRLEFINQGSDRTVRTVMACNGSLSATFSVRGAGKTIRWMHMPMAGTGVWGMSLAFYDADTGRLLQKQDWSARMTSVSRRGSYYGSGSSSDEFAVVTVAAGRGPTVSSNLCEPDTVVVSEIGPDMVPDSWVGLSSVDLLIVTADAWASPRMETGPILDWVAMGGVCLVVDATKEQQDAIGRTLAEQLPAVEARGETVSAGMGRLVFMPARGLLASRLFPNGANLSAARGTGGTDPARLQPTLPVVQKPPFLPVLFFLVAFSLLVGPLGWWYLVTKKGRPLMYYALAPALSVCVIVLVIVADVLKQGVTPLATAIGSEFIDQRAKKRITLSQFVVYCPFTVGRTLRGGSEELPDFLALSSQGPYSGLGYGMGGVSADVTSEGVTYNGALPARQKAWYSRQSIRLERRRLEVWKEAGKVQVENHLGVPLRDVLVCCEGEYGLVDSLADGAKASASPLARAEALRDGLSQVAKAGGRYSGLITGRSWTMNARWQQAFESGRNAYIATRDGAFDELIWLEGARFSNSASAIRGLY